MTAIEFNTKLTGLQKNLQYFATSLTGNTDDALDLMQDTYLKALLNRHKFEDDTNLKAWTFTIMKNTFINNYRKNNKINTVIDNTEDLFFLNIQRKSEFPAPDSEYQAKEIRKNIAKLDETQRLPFEMYHAGFKYQEIADNLNISIGTVKSRIFFTRKRLMEELVDYQN